MRGQKLKKQPGHVLDILSVLQVTIFRNVPSTWGRRLLEKEKGKERCRTFSFVLSTLYPDIMAATKGNVGAVENIIALPKFITESRMLLLPRMIAKGKC
jgi:hypothetical protein